MKETEYIEDPEFGHITARRDTRLRRLKMTILPEGLRISIPYGVSLKRVTDWIDSVRPQIRAKMRKVEKRSVGTIDEEHPLQTLTFTTEIKATNEKKVIYFNLREGVLHILYPHEMNPHDTETQQKIKTGIKHFMRLEAKRVLPKRVNELAEKWGFRHNGVKIQDSHTRWGSCNSKGNINLSLYIMLLTPDLADSVMLHELCHTVEMNHSDRFRALMDKVTEGRSEKWKKDIKGFSCRL